MFLTFFEFLKMFLSKVLEQFLTVKFFLKSLLFVNKITLLAKYCFKSLFSELILKE